MKRRRFSEEQIIGLLQRNESGVTASQLCREVAISESTFYQWNAPRGHQVWRNECERSQAVAPAGSGERAIETDRGGSGS